MFLTTSSNVDVPSFGPDTVATSVTQSVAFSATVVTNQAVTVDPGVQQMPSIAVDPHDSMHLVIAYMDYTLATDDVGLPGAGFAGIGIATSFDGGVSFQYTSLSLPTGFDQGAANPTVQFDDIGHIYASFMAATYFGEAPPLTNPDSGNLRALGFESTNGVFISRSDDGGLTWLSPVAVESHVYDENSLVPFDIIPDLVIDNFAVLHDGSPNPFYGTLYATFARYYPAGQFPGEPDSIGGSDLIMATSNDLGQTWTIRLKADDLGTPTTVLQDPFNNGIDPPAGFGYNNYLHATIGPEGDIYTAEYSGGWLSVNHSRDGGTSFFIPTQEDEFGMPFGLGPVGLDFGLSSNEFRTLPVRAIVADPLRLGFVYVAEPQSVVDSSGQLLDDSDIIFSRSTDYGQTWDREVRVGPMSSQAINDDNLGITASGAPDEVVSSQVMVKMATNAAGWLVLAWYDSRRDPANHQLDVFATISKDGGKTFSPNFRLTDQSFDPDVGKFIDATGETSSYIGDSIGLAMSDTAISVAWTDTRSGSQDIYFSQVLLSSLPLPPNDRFEPNESAANPTILGTVIERNLPLLSISSTDNDWFEFESIATGTLSITATSESDIRDLRLELRSSSSDLILPIDLHAVKDTQGSVHETSFSAPATSGADYSLRVTSLGGVLPYQLRIKSFTDDLGVVVHRLVDSQLQVGDEVYYLVESAADGSMEAKLNDSDAADQRPLLELIDPESLQVFADNQSAAAKAAVVKGQKLLVHLRSSSNVATSFHLELTNYDQFSNNLSSTLRFQAGLLPSQSVVGDFNADGLPDVVVSNAGSNTVSVLLANGDGTFQAPRQFAVGAFRTPNPVADDFRLTTYRRDVASADFNLDGYLDLAVTNFDSSDISVLLGRGDGTFEPQRRFDATANPFGLTIGDVNNDGLPDISVVEGAAENSSRHLAVLLGRGDGTFMPQQLILLDGILALPTISLVDLDGDQTLDLIVAGGLNDGIGIYHGLGDGTFTHMDHLRGSRQAADIVSADLTGDGVLDILVPSLTVPGSIVLFVGHDDGTFDDGQTFFSGEGPLAVALVDWGSEIETDDGIKMLGPPDGHLDAVVANSGASVSVSRPGPPEIVVLPQVLNDDGSFAGFGAPQRIANVSQPLDIHVADFDQDGILDLGVVDRNEFLTIFANPPNLAGHQSISSAADLGVVVHSVQPTLTITPDHHEIYYKVTVPIEGVAGTQDEVMDISSGIQNQNGDGIQMEILDARANVIAIGDRVRIRAEQGSVLYVRLRGLKHNSGVVGTGAYTLVINALPQVVSVDAQTLLPGIAGHPGSATSSLTITFQGDRLDPITAQNPDNYRVFYWGDDNTRGTSDDQVVPVGGETISQPAVYDASANIDITSGLSYPTAIKQTVTLTFATPLPSGSYTIELSDKIQTAIFNADELSLLSLRDQYGNHPVVQLSGSISMGANLNLVDFVQPATRLGDISIFDTGNSFLTQLQNDLQSLLDAALSELGDDPTITNFLLHHIQDRILPGLGSESKRATSLLILFFDPFPFVITNRFSEGRLDYDSQRNTLDRSLSTAYVQVGRNLDFVVIPQAEGTYRLDIANVPQLPRGGAVILSQTQTEVRSLTTDVRAGERSFLFDVVNNVPASRGAPGVPSSGVFANMVSAFASSKENAVSIQTTGASLFSGDIARPIRGTQPRFGDTTQNSNSTRSQFPLDDGERFQEDEAEQRPLPELDSDNRERDKLELRRRPRTSRPDVPERESNPKPKSADINAPAAEEGAVRRRQSTTPPVTAPVEPAAKTEAVHRDEPSSDQAQHAPVASVWDAFVLMVRSWIAWLWKDVA